MRCLPRTTDQYQVSVISGDKLHTTRTRYVRTYRQALWIACLYIARLWAKRYRITWIADDGHRWGLRAKVGRNICRALVAIEQRV